MNKPAAVKPAPRADVPNDLEGLLAAVHPQPRLQEEAAPHLARQGHELFHARGAHDPGRDGGPVVLQREAPTAPRSWRQFSVRRRSSTSRRPSRSPIRPTFQLASRLAELAPGGPDHAFYCNSGSEACDQGAQDRDRLSQCAGATVRAPGLVGRERAYHGVGFGGISVGGMVNNRKFFGSLLAGVDHLPATYNREHQAFTKGEPEWGAHLADALEGIVALHDPSTIAAVIVEPVAGSAGVLPAPKGYLERLRAICSRYGILLIFDEVITGFGRTGDVSRQSPMACSRTF